MANEEAALNELYGLTTRSAIDFSSTGGYRRDEVYPYEDDTLDIIIVKARRWEKIIREGGSLAAAFGMLDGTMGGTDFVGAAEAAMLSEERRLWFLWKKHGKMPPLDLAKDKAANPQTAPTADAGIKKAKKSVEERVRAMRRLYKSEKIEEGHYFFFVSKWSSLIPLVIAAVKVETARKAASSGTGADPRRFQEMLAARLAQGCANQVKQREAEALKQRTREITTLLTSVHTRKLAVTDVGEARNRKADPLGNAGVLLGATPVQAPTHYTAPQGAGRLVRNADLGMGALGLAKGALKRTRPATTRADADMSPLRLRSGRELGGGDGRRQEKRARRSVSPRYTPQSPQAGPSGVGLHELDFDIGAGYGEEEEGDMQI